MNVLFATDVPVNVTIGVDVTLGVVAVPASCTTSGQRPPPPSRSWKDGRWPQSHPLFGAGGGVVVLHSCSAPASSAFSMPPFPLGF